MSEIRKLPVGVQDFESLRTDGFLYVDKTRYLYELARLSLPYFLSRPRRFGKSLFLSTLKAYFLGKRELFEGLAIGELEKDWIEYPVIYIDLNSATYKSEETLDNVLDDILKEYEQKWEVTDISKELSLRFKNIIKTAHKKTGQRVVVLVDEYDKPLLDTIQDETLNYSIRQTLRGFYGILKNTNAFLRFTFLTGITKFSQVSVFSDLNNLMDISFDDKYAGICGISETELLQYFQPEIKTLAEKNKLSDKNTLAKLKKRYNGYHFCENNAEGMYNPFSLLNVFSQYKFKNYWFATGTPTFLYEMLQKSHFEIPDLEDNVHITASDVNDYRIDSTDPVPVLYQSGYLTIKGYDSELDEFILGFPNNEVKYGFLRGLLRDCVPQFKSKQQFSVGSFLQTLRECQIDKFMENLRSFYSSIPYDLVKNEHKGEQYYQFIFYLLVTLMGQFVQTEVRTATGRIDAVIKTSDTIYVFEFKMSDNAAAEDALSQIDTKNYLIPYSTDGRTLVKIGVEFSNEERTIKRWILG
jgi:hypothetical protein